jgi:hypothetical protein
MSILSTTGRMVAVGGDAHNKSEERVRGFIKRSSKLRVYANDLETFLEMYGMGIMTPCMELVVQYVSQKLNWEELEPSLLSLSAIKGEMDTKHISPFPPPVYLDMHPYELRSKAWILRFGDTKEGKCPCGKVIHKEVKDYRYHLLESGKYEPNNLIPVCNDCEEKIGLLRGMDVKSYYFIYHQISI